MWTRAFGFAAVLISASLLLPLDAASADSDAVVRKRIIKESIASYPGNCPCPYNTARNGSSCGRRSAWSRQGGYATLCYDDDVTKPMIEEWRQAHAASRDPVNSHGPRRGAKSERMLTE